MPKQNNFDLVRLVAALQVAIVHMLVHFDLADSVPWLRAFLEIVPGVPVFFFVSGFLISRSYEKNSVLKEFALNRVLRIYPGLIGCLFLSVMSVFLVGYFSTVDVSAKDFFVWLFAQSTFLQFYNPEFLRGYGVGVLNGSAWTIAVEFQFYILIPLVYAFFRLQRIAPPQSNLLLIALIIGFLLVNRAYVYLGADLADALEFKLFVVSFAPWFYMFLLGVLCQRNFARIYTLLAGKFLFLLAGYIFLSVLAMEGLGWRFGNSINPLFLIALAALTFSAAFSAEGLSDNILRRNDVSYDVYLYHMPVINCLIALDISNEWFRVLLASIATVLLAFLSWRCIEKPALRRKRHPLYQHDASGAAS